MGIFRFQPTEGIALSAGRELATTSTKPIMNTRSGSSSKSNKQVRYLLSKVSPLKEAQKEKLLKELHSGKVKVLPRQR